MKSMQKKAPPRVSKGKTIRVADDSLQTKAPGAGPGPSRGNLQSGSPGGWGSDQGGRRGGPGAQQSGWSSRQQADRIMARGEESRLGMTANSAGSLSKAGGGSKQ